jgi:hypothetical protein
MKYLILLLFIASCASDPAPVVYPMDYNQVLKHMHGSTAITKIQKDSSHWEVVLPDGIHAVIQESTRVDLCVVFGKGFC